MNKVLEGRVVVLTGGNGFLGRQYAKGLELAGASVVLLDKKKVPGEVLPPHCFKQVDITNEEDVHSVMREIHTRYGRIDALINNAAMNPAVGDPASVAMKAPYEHYPLHLFRKEFEVNVVGMQICMLAVAPFMMEAKSGSIVNIASEVSVAAYDWTDVYKPGEYKSPAYIASKHAVVGLTKAWAAYLGRYDVRVNAFSPGGMQKEGMPAEFVVAYSKKNMLGSMAQLEDYNDIIVFLCSDASRRMTGANLLADGGRTAW